MKKYLILFLGLFAAIALAGCRGNSVLSEKPPAGARQLGVLVENVEADRGDVDVVVRVCLNNDPGFLTMAMKISYDSQNMELIKVRSGSDYSDYNFIGPKNKQSGCIASWFTPELTDEIHEGSILELHFQISESAAKGDYAVTVSHPGDEGVVDRYKNPLHFDDATGYIHIK